MKTPAWLSFVVTAGLLIGALFGRGMTERNIHRRLAMPLDRIPSEMSGWKRINEYKLDPPSMRTLRPTSYLARSYRKDDSEISLLIAYYERQRPGEGMHSPQHCLPGEGWEVLRLTTTTVPVADQEVAINEARITNLNSTALMLYWYQSRRRIVANEYIAKLLLARDTLFTGQNSGSLVRVILGDNKRALTEGKGFASLVIPRVQACLGKL